MAGSRNNAESGRGRGIRGVGERVRGVVSKFRHWKDRKEKPQESSFLEAIGRPDLREVLTARTPWAYWTMEIYADDIKGQGGLGILASDTRKEAIKTGLPMVVVTPFYRKEAHQAVDGDLHQEVFTLPIAPESRGYKKTGIKVDIHTKNGEGENCPLDVYTKQEGTVTTLTITEPEFRELYAGENNSAHRLYQEVALGFGGYKALKKLQLVPSMNQMNEAPTVFATIARLDDQLDETGDLSEAVERVRKNTVYTNHTLVQAVEARFTLAQFEAYVEPNIRNPEIVKWMREMFKIEKEGDEPSIRLSTLALELAGKINGVSRIHAREASKVYVRANGEHVKFEPVTNGIAIDEWGDPNLLALYRDAGIFRSDNYDLLSEGYARKIYELDADPLKKLKDNAHANLISYLRSRSDQFGESVHIPEGARIITWKKRMADYKRPEMVLKDPDRFAQMLEENDFHFVFSGRAHPKDKKMQAILSEMLTKINNNAILKQRVHYIQDYDEDLAAALAQGADISLNMPEVYDKAGNPTSTEACGTSWEKDILGNTILISTDDGGVADRTVLAEQRGEADGLIQAYLRITGNTYDDEASSLYAQLGKAISYVRGDPAVWGERVKLQLAAYLDVISGERMMKDYINFAFPIDQRRGGRRKSDLAA